MELLYSVHLHLAPTCIPTPGTPESVQKVCSPKVHRQEGLLLPHTRLHFTFHIQSVFFFAKTPPQQSYIFDGPAAWRLGNFQGHACFLPPQPPLSLPGDNLHSFQFAFPQSQALVFLIFWLPKNFLGVQNQFNCS